ncbi:IlvD/Edd family dehydratase [Robiginitalea sediminis]|uniref:IlvD/Edd family dehydratase n=1 Tax=Robiginitalea sediminis TaxID=1982593 RepID=UPI000B4B0126|nr:IlvD/Edd family dehydratase [Robiginitalea sediminis]
MTKKKLRSAEWFGRDDKMGFVHRSWMRNQGHPDHMFRGKPVIGICNTWSDLSPCNAHLREFADIVKRGVYEAGGFPLEFPVMSFGETLMKPTSMLWRNLVSMDTEESIRANPLDGIVLLTGCDKTTPSTLMGAASVDLPTIVVPGGPMLNGKFRGRDIGSGTATWQLDEQRKAGTLTQEEFLEAESCMSRSAGHCMTMGTASTMATMVEALGLTLPGASAIPAVDARKKVMAHLSGNRIVGMVKEGLNLSRILTRKAFENAIKVNSAVGGSTNLIIHLTAIAGRIGVDLNLADFDRLGSNLPLLLNLMPSGKYLMEDYYYAGGLPVILEELAGELHMDCITVNGKTLRENNSGIPCYNREVIARMESPVKEQAGIAVLTGNLCEDGAVIKPAAATPALLKHKGRAVVFTSVEDYHRRIDDPDLDVQPDDVLVLQGVGPVGYPGMPEVGNFALPQKLIRAGVTDMVRISDGRMSGTAYGTVVLHVAPESAIGGNLALVRNGDLIELDVPARTLTLCVPEEELRQRKEQWTPPPPVAQRGYASMYIREVEQAHKGCDFGFLKGGSGSDVSRNLH